jgi:hypothetical protein
VSLCRFPSQFTAPLLSTITAKMDVSQRTYYAISV